MKRFASILAVFAANSSAFAADQRAIVLAAKGVQVYGCAHTGESYAWKLTGPEAILTDAAGHPAGRHFGGPTWQAADGKYGGGRSSGGKPSTQQRRDPLDLAAGQETIRAVASSRLSLI